MWSREERIGPLNTYYYPHQNPAQYSMMIIPGTGGHGAQYDDFCELHRMSGVDIYCVDLPGHGKSPGERGSFTQDECMEGMLAVAGEIKRRVSRPLIVLGSSMGSGYALNLLNASDDVDGCVSMGVQMWSARVYDEQRAIYNSQALDFIIGQWGDALKWHIFEVLDLERNYGAPEVARERYHDPLQLKTFTLSSIRSLFTYQPPVPIGETASPFLMAVGENDPYSPMHLVEGVFEEVGGPKEKHIERGAGHQLMLQHAERFSETINEWFGRHFAGWQGQASPLER